MPSPRTLTEDDLVALSERSWSGREDDVADLFHSLTGAREVLREIREECHDCTRCQARVRHALGEGSS